MPPIDEPASFGPKPSKGEERGARSKAAAPEQAAPAELVAFTVDATSGHIVTIEAVDAAGARHEMSDEGKARLTRGPARATLERVIEQAFQAGIDCVLGDGGAEERESKDDAELSRVLLLSLIERSGVRRLMQRDALHRAIVATLIEHAAASGSAAAH